jgi:hypothetical protein
MRKTMSAIMLFSTAIVSQAYSQSLSLPSLDGISVFYRGGRLAKSSALQASQTAPCLHGLSSFSTCGWGFETVYQLTKASKESKETKETRETKETKETVETKGTVETKITETTETKETKKTESKASKWGAELAVGYDFLNLRATLHSNNAYQILGSVQTLPSITLYVSRDLGRTPTSVYFGLGTGLLLLKNVRAYDASGRIYSIDGNTWALTPSIGATYRLLEAKENSPGASFFVEASYEVRDFPSIAYTLPSDVKTLPSDLPRSLSASGPVLNVGFEISLYKAPK